MWDLRSGVCIMILAGTGGHKNEVLSCDLHPSGLRLASCGMDNTVCVWELERHAQLFEEAAVWEGPPGRFETRFVTYADFSTHLVHSNYVDCVRWVGDLLLTKSVDSRILMWRPVEDATRQRAAPQPPFPEKRRATRCVASSHSDSVPRRREDAELATLGGRSNKGRNVERSRCTV